MNLSRHCRRVLCYVAETVFFFAVQFAGELLYATMPERSGPWRGRMP